MTTHTPGPWFCEAGYHVVHAENGTLKVADCNGALTPGHGVSYPIDHDQREANARLIAAAPELLEALGEAITFVLAGNAIQMAKGLAEDEEANEVTARWQAVVDKHTVSETGQES